MKERDIVTRGRLFRRVQTREIFNDSKTFVDAVPDKDPGKIIKDIPEKGLKEFVAEKFELPQHREIKTEQGLDIDEYIDRSWDFLERTGKEDRGTYIGLQNSFIVPGGRFRETYYWDSFFTLLGLEKSGREDLVISTIENTADMIDRFGFVPNGNRSYYLSRSQPPFFGEMLKVLENKSDKGLETKFIDCLEKEYRYWMEPGRSLEIEGSLLNRYWSEKQEPRPESYIEDFQTWENSSRGKEIFRDIRAGCESGWDFSTRWTAGKGLENIRTTDYLPLDLNSILYSIEKQLSRYRNGEKAQNYRKKARERKESFDKFFWSEEKEFYFDYRIEEGKRSESWTLASTFPLYFGLASERQADKVAKTLEEKFLEKGGLKTTLKEGLQWDSPNGWPPLQYIAVKGLLNYGKAELAEEIASRWLETCEKVYSTEGTMLEKYNMVNPLEDVKDGEYDNQEGFGWTNGVYLEMKDLEF